MALLFVDIETTGLDPRRHVPWEVAIIEQDGTEHVWRWRPHDLDLSLADPNALEINGFHTRSPETYDYQLEREAAEQVAELVEGNVIVGSNPCFDVTMLTAWLQPKWLTWAAHYRPVCAITTAAGWLHARQDRTGVLEEPWSSWAISRACGVEPPGDDAHQALADARWVRRLYHKVANLGDVS